LVIEFNVEDLYHALLKKGLSTEDIDSKIKEITSNLGGYITDQAALFFLAKEYGLDILTKESYREELDELEEIIDYDEFTVKISEIQPETTNIVLIGKVIKSFGVKVFARKDGTSGKVGSVLIQDDSGTIKVVLWDDQSDIVQLEAFQENVLVRVIGGYSKVNGNGKVEVHLSRRSKVEFVLNDANVSNKNSEVNPLSVNSELSIEDALNSKDRAINSISGEVSDIIEFKEINLKNGNKTFLFKFLLSDENSSITVLVWDLDATYFFKSVKIGDMLKLNNIFLKFNKFSDQKELIYTKKSIVVKISEL